MREGPLRIPVIEAPVSQRRPARVNPLRIDDNLALRSLAEDLCQSDRRHGAGTNSPGSMPVQGFDIAAAVDEGRILMIRHSSASIDG